MHNTIGYIELLRTRSRTVLLAMGCLLGMIGCKPDTTVGLLEDPRTLLWSVTLNHRAVVISDSAPFDTVQLVATPRNMYGEALAGIVSDVKYTTLDTTITLFPNGFVRASSPTSANGARVIASINSGTTTQVDTVYIIVKPWGATVSPVRKLELYRSDADSASTSLGEVYVPNIADTAGMSFFFPGAPTPTYRVRAILANGDTISVPGSFASSDLTVATISRLTGVVTRIGPGTTTLRGSAYIGGVVMEDSLSLKIRNQLLSNIMFYPNVIGRYSAVIGVNGTVVFFNGISGATPIDVMFDNPSAVSGVNYGSFAGQGGNITGQIDGQRKFRVFRTPGVYPYHVVGYPKFTGTITVVAD